MYHSQKLLAICIYNGYQKGKMLDSPNLDPSFRAVFVSTNPQQNCCMRKPLESAKL